MKVAAAATQRGLQRSPVNCYFLDNRTQKYQYQRWRSPCCDPRVNEYTAKSAISALSVLPPNQELPLREIFSRRSASVPETRPSPLPGDLGHTLNGQPGTH